MILILYNRENLASGFCISLDGVEQVFLRRRPSRLTQFCVSVY